MRLRSLRRLEEMELRRERDELVAEQTALTALLDDDAAQRKSVAEDVKSFNLPSPAAISAARASLPCRKLKATRSMYWSKRKRSR